MKNGRFPTSLCWYHRKEKLPTEGNRILIFLEIYEVDDPNRLRIIDSQFFKIFKDADWWAYINEPQINDNK